MTSPPDQDVGWTAAGHEEPLRVLVVDDDPHARAALAGAVRALGHVVTVARDGVEAWQLHERSPFHVIVSDRLMPRLEGTELLRRARSLDAGMHRYTYLVLVTAMDGREDFLAGMRAGADDYLVKPVDLDQLEARLRVAARVASSSRRIAAHAETLRLESARHFAQARTDALTEASNRLHLREDLEVLADRARRYGHRYCAALCDLDAFKSYNDRFGHLAGDTALRAVARAVRAHLRAGDTLYRFGGEEFLIILPEQTIEGALSCMERVRGTVEALATRAMGGELASEVTVSIGIAEYRSTDGTVETWLQRADEALYRAKERGRNVVCVA